MRIFVLHMRRMLTPSQMVVLCRILAEINSKGLQKFVRVVADEEIKGFWRQWLWSLVVRAGELQQPAPGMPVSVWKLDQLHPWWVAKSGKLHGACLSPIWRKYLGVSHLRYAETLGTLHDLSRGYTERFRLRKDGYGDVYSSYWWKTIDNLK